MNPVEIRGEVLPAGRYVFKIVDREADRDVVQVYSSNKSHLYGLFLTTPDHRITVSSKVVVRFLERAAGPPRPGYGVQRFRSLDV